MRKIKICNNSNSNIFVNNGDLSVYIEVGESKSVCVNDKQLYIHRNTKKSSSFRISQYPALLMENMWMIGIIYCLNFDCCIKLKARNSVLTITEKNFSFRDQVIFSTYVVDTDDSCDLLYHSPKDKLKCTLLLYSTSLIYFVFAFILTLSMIIALFEEFLFTYIAILIIALVVLFDSALYIKDSIKFVAINKNTQHIISESKIISIQKNDRHFIKYVKPTDVSQF